MKMKNEAAEKRKLLLKEWENVECESVLKVNFSKLYFEKAPDISCFTNLIVQIDVKDYSSKSHF